MRKVRFKARWALSVFFATVLISISCVKNDPQTTIEEPMLGTKPFSSDLARSLQKSFERDYQETRVRSISDADTTLYFEGLSPKWEFAVRGYSPTKNKEYLEVPIDAEIALLTEGIHSDPSLLEGDEVELTNSTYLAIEKSLSTGSERSYFISYIPSKRFIEEGRSFVHRPGFVPNQFDGVVQYHELNGDYINGYVFEDGLATKIIKRASEEINQGNSSRGYDCVAKFVSESYSWTGLEYDLQNHVWIFTTYWSTRTRFVGYDCTYTYTHFQTELEIDPGSGGGGGGSNVEPPEEEPKPCESKDGKRSNPLVVMALAPTSGDKYSAGRYGYTRPNGRFHNGIDLHAEVGTPVYAMMDGIVTRVVSSQPDRDDKYSNSNKLPDEYNNDPKNDKNKAGNRITVKTVIDGDVIEHSYWHLQAGNAIGINPETGKKYKLGDRVRKGDIIGYTGITGNAYNVPNPHLHLNMRKNGKNCNPEEFLNATVKNQSKIETPCDK
ncbi:MAG: M23 family metallopeptidase [Bacteroidia bacterium]